MMSGLLPSSGSVKQIDFAIQSGRAAAASVIGQTYDIRRLDANTNGSISNNEPVLPAFPASIQRLPKTKAENEIFGLLAYKATCTNLVLAIGDLCTETGYGQDGGVFYVAQKRPLRETIWMRAESAINITRPQPTAGAVSQQPQPSQGWVVAESGTWSGIAKDTEEVLTLTNGLYSFSSDPAASPAVVYAGLQPRPIVKPGTEPKLPGVGKLATTLDIETFVIYLPLLPGEEVSEYDRIAFSQIGDRYEVHLVFTTADTGLAGYIIVATKLPN
jgi:hypothetical protein